MVFCNICIVCPRLTVGFDGSHGFVEKTVSSPSVEFGATCSAYPRMVTVAEMTIQSVANTANFPQTVAMLPVACSEFLHILMFVD